MGRKNRGGGAGLAQAKELAEMLNCTSSQHSSMSCWQAPRACEWWSHARLTHNGWQVQGTNTTGHLAIREGRNYEALRDSFEFKAESKRLRFTLFDTHMQRLKHNSAPVTMRQSLIQEVIKQSVERKFNNISVHHALVRGILSASWHTNCQRKFTNLIRGLKSTDSKKADRSDVIITSYTDQLHQAMLKSFITLNHAHIRP